MNSKRLKFLQTFGAYSCALFIGVYLASSYSEIATQAVFILIPIIALKMARARTSRSGDLLRFPAEAESASTHEFAERDLDSHSRYIDIVSRAS